jgi:hypothetical protein
MDQASGELNEVFSRLSRRHEFVPFMALMLSIHEAAFMPLPSAMLAILRSSRDYKSVQPGAAPTWFQIATENDVAELVVYRAEADGRHYVLAPL